MKAILEFELPESCLECPIRYVDAYLRLLCAFISNTDGKNPPDTLKPNFDNNPGSGGARIRALNCPLKIV